MTVLGIVFFILMGVAIICYSTFGATCGYPAHIYFKMACSTIFIIAGICFYLYYHQFGNNKSLDLTALFILIGLFFGWFGDLLLDLSAIYGEKLFIFGIASFAANHIFFVIAFFHLYGLKMPDIPIYIIIVAAVFLLGIFVYKVEITKGLLIPTIIYILIISLMLTKALSFLWSGSPANGMTTTEIVLLIGAALFFISDSVLALSKFTTTAPSYFGLINSITYFYGQLFMTYAILLLPKKV